MAAPTEKASPVTNVVEGIEVNSKQRKDEDYQSQSEEKVKFSHYFVLDCFPSRSILGD